MLIAAVAVYPRWPGSHRGKRYKQTAVQGPRQPIPFFRSRVSSFNNGNVTTDASGRAVVRLSNYFEALNSDFRYQLTVIGQFAQAIVREEIKDNQFVIRTSRPRVKVSWQVTGIRRDAFANTNRIRVTS